MLAAGRSTAKCEAAAALSHRLQVLARFWSPQEPLHLCICIYFKTLRTPACMDRPLGPSSALVCAASLHSCAHQRAGPVIRVLLLDWGAAAGISICTNCVLEPGPGLRC